MNREGWQTITAALEAENITATVVPVPKEDQDVRFVTIGTEETLAPAHLLNALAMKRMVEYDGAQDAGFRRGPVLRPLGVQPGSITFEDINRWN
jgi:hypothetical protein